MARSLERAWEDRLRAADAIEQEYRQWRQQDPVVLRAEDFKALERLASDLPALWHAPTTQPEERKRILRMIIQEVLLDQKRSRGEVWIKIIWQTGAVSEHRLLRCVHSYNEDYADLDYLRDRITQLNAEGLVDKQVAAVLNDEGVVSARRRPFTYENVWLLRQRWGLPAVKLSSSVRRVQVQLGGPTAPILCRARLRRSVSTPTPSLATLLTAFSPGDKKPRDSPGRSILRPSKLVSCSDDYYTPDDQERRRHEKLSSPNTEAHSPKLRLVVMMTLVRS